MAGFRSLPEETVLYVVYADVRLANPYCPDREPLDAKALVVTGATHLCLPQHIALQLGLITLKEREVTTAGGARQLVPYAGPVRVSMLGRECYVGALVMGDQVLLGAIPLEDMDLVISPRMQCVTVNPEAPNVPMALAK
jgi:clan AA aspartic protease